MKNPFKHELVGQIDYPGKGIISDEDVWQLVRSHSRLIDRMSWRKMVEMAIYGQTILMGIYEGDGWRANDYSWKFYGKDGFITRYTESS